MLRGCVPNIADGHRHGRRASIDDGEMLALVVDT